jgi:hypothetical protein
MNTKLSPGNLKTRYHFEGLNIYGRIILKWILKLQGVKV